jgi:hypothetical protein
VLVPKRQAEQLAARAGEDFEEYYVAKQALETLGSPAEEPVLVLSLDGKGIVMRPEDLRDATRKKAEAWTPHLTARLAPGEKPHAKRMATVATVYMPAATSAARKMSSRRQARIARLPHPGPVLPENACGKSSNRKWRTSSTGCSWRPRAAILSTPWNGLWSSTATSSRFAS